MAANKAGRGKGVKAAVAGMVMKYAIDFVNNPDNLQLIVNFFKSRPRQAPLASSARSLTLPLPKGKWGRLDRALDAAEVAVDGARANDALSPRAEEWSRSLASLRSAVPLAKAAQGRDRRRKLADLQERTNTLLNEIYAATVGARNQ